MIARVKLLACKCHLVNFANSSGPRSFEAIYDGLMKKEKERENQQKTVYCKITQHEKS